MISGRCGRVIVEEDENEASLCNGDPGSVELGVASLRNSRASSPLLTAETEKLSFLINLIAICWLISSKFGHQ